MTSEITNIPATTTYSSSSASDIVNQAYMDIFDRLTWCPIDMDANTCFKETFERIAQNKTDVPWWFQTMLRDAQRVVSTPWHNNSAHNVTNDGKGLHYCAIEKVGIKHWKRLFCGLQNQEFKYHTCVPDDPVPDNAPHAIFLRDPLERFLSAYMDKCLELPQERHCEPTSVFLDHENGHTKGLDKKLLFEAYADAMPLKWNMHFFPQRYVKLFTTK